MQYQEMTGSVHVICSIKTISLKKREVVKLWCRSNKHLSFHFTVAQEFGIKREWKENLFCNTCFSFKTFCFAEIAEKEMTRTTEVQCKILMSIIEIFPC